MSALRDIPQRLGSGIVSPRRSAWWGREGELQNAVGPTVNHALFTVKRQRVWRMKSLSSDQPGATGRQQRLHPANEIVAAHAGRCPRFLLEGSDRSRSREDGDTARWCRRERVSYCAYLGAMRVSRNVRVRRSSPSRSEGFSSSPTILLSSTPSGSACPFRWKSRTRTKLGRDRSGCPKGFVYCTSDSRSRSCSATSRPPMLGRLLVGRRTSCLHRYRSSTRSLVVQLYRR